jgi:hypothetical protein
MGAMLKPQRFPRLATGLVLGLGLVLTACGSEDADPGATADSEHEEASADHEEHHDEDDEAPGEARTEVDEPQPRLVVAHDNGAFVVDAETGEVLGSFDTVQRPALAVAGDGRHVFLTQDEANLTQVLDAGSWGMDHGDHAHYYIAEPALKDTQIEGDYPVHVVSHDDETAIFNDGDGTATIFRDAGLRIDSLDVRTVDSGAPHHGVVVPADGFSIVSIPSDDEEDTLPLGVAVVDDAGVELARFENCPGLHGEAALGHTVAFACADGILLVDGEDARKVDYPSDEGRTGSFTMGPADEYLVGNFTATSLLALHVEDGTAHEISVDEPYAARALDEHGDLVVLTTDGTLHVIDPADGDVEATVEGVLEPFEIPEDWREPRPTIVVAGHTAFVADPATSTVIPVDLEHQEVESTFALDAIPTSITAVGTGGGHSH